MFYQLLRELRTKDICSSHDLEFGFIRALENIEDMVIDVPHCPEYAGKYLGCALADGLLGAHTAGAVLQSIECRSSEVAMRVSVSMISCIKDKKVRLSNTILFEPLEANIWCCVFIFIFCCC
jgi:hypothetical protein